MSDFLPPDFLHSLDATGLPLALNFIEDMFSPLIDLLRGYLRILDDFLGSWGWAIIVLTLSVRVVIFPLTWKQIKSQRAMQALQPKIKELQRKFKGDRKKLQQETMRLYQQYSINPLASCFPLLLQLPIFISLYYAIRGTPELQDATFLWFTLGQPDPYYILLVVYVASQLASTELMLTPETQSQQKWIMRAMPFVFIIILRNFPSGLFLYWITTNLWTVAQAGTVRYLGKKHPMQLEPVDPSKRKRSRFMDAMAAAQDDKDAQRGSGGRSRASGQRSASGKKKRRPPQGARAAAAVGTTGSRSSGKRSSSTSADARPKKRRPAASAAGAEGGRESAAGKPKKRKASSADAPRKKQAPSGEARRKKQAPAGGEKRRKDGREAQPGAQKKTRSERRKRASGKDVQTTRTGKRPVKPKPPKPSTESQS